MDLRAMQGVILRRRRATPQIEEQPARHACAHAFRALADRIPPFGFTANRAVQLSPGKTDWRPLLVAHRGYRSGSRVALLGVASC